jgi:hypothetical protein
MGTGSERRHWLGVPVISGYHMTAHMSCPQHTLLDSSAIQRSVRASPRRIALSLVHLAQFNAVLLPFTQPVQFGAELAPLLRDPTRADTLKAQVAVGLATWNSLPFLVLALGSVFDLWFKLSNPFPLCLLRFLKLLYHRPH